MKQENIDIIANDVLKLFDIMIPESQINLINKLTEIKGSKGSISDNINSCNDVELIELIKVIMKCKFNEDPKPYFTEIISIIKSETNK